MLPPTDQDGRPLAPPADAAQYGSVFPELLDLVRILLQQHETRLCLNMLEALKETESAHVMHTLQDFVKVQFSSPNEGLQVLAQRVQGLSGCEFSYEVPRKRGKYSILDGAGGTVHQAVGAMENGTRTSVEAGHDTLCSSAGRPTAYSLASHKTKEIFEVGGAKTKEIFADDGAAASAAHPTNGFRVSPYLEMNGSSANGASASSKQSQNEGHSATLLRDSSGPEAELPSAAQCDEHEEDDDFSDDCDDDLSENENDKRGMSVTGVKNQAFSMKKRKCIVHPSSSGRLAWDCAGLAFVCGEGVLVPLSLGFDVDMADWWQWSATVFFAMDTVSQFFTGFFRNGILIMQHRIIIFHYLTTFFFIDLIATVPWEVLLEGIAGNSATTLSLARIARVGKTLRLFRLIRVFRIVRMKELLNHLEALLSAYKAGLVLHLLKVPTACLVICHWAACIWGFLGEPDPTAEPHRIKDVCEPGGPCENGIEGSPWVRRYGLDNYEAATRYLIALQSSAGLLTGVGMGVEPGFWIERIYILCMMIGSFFLCAVILSRIVVVVDEMSKSQSELKKQLRDAKAFMLIRKIPRTLQSKVIQHIEFQAKSSVESQAMSKNFMASLSPWLRLEITEHMNRGIILHHPFFAELPNKLVKHICSAMQIVICAPGDIVVQQGHRATNMCFLVQGRLKVRPPQSQRKTQGANRPAPSLMEPPCWIGDLCLFQEEVIRTNTVLSVGHAELLVLTKEALLALIQEFPGARHYYEAYKTRLRDEEELTATNKIKCQYCGQPGHLGPDCPDLEKVCAGGSQKQRHWHSAKMLLKPLRFLASNIHDSRISRTSNAESSRRTKSEFETLDSVVCNQKEANGMGSKIISFPERSTAAASEGSAILRKGEQQVGNRYATGDTSSANSRRDGDSAVNPSGRTDTLNAWSSSCEFSDTRMPGQPPKSSDEDDPDNLLR